VIGVDDRRARAGPVGQARGGVAVAIAVKALDGVSCGVSIGGSTSERRVIVVRRRRRRGRAARRRKKARELGRGGAALRDGGAASAVARRRGGVRCASLQRAAHAERER
jgi:hypothetical protein